MPCRVERNIERILELLAGADVHATFFTLGWIAERYPTLIRRVVDAGHELASHGYEHRRATRSGLWRVPGRHPPREGGARGHRGRAGSRAIARPASRSGRATAGPSSASRTRAIDTARASIRSGTIITAPPAVSASRTKSTPDCSRCRLQRCASCGRRGPRVAGGYFRLLPYRVSRWSLRRINDAEGRPAMFYFHPWELDPEQPRVDGRGCQGAVSPLSQPRTDGVAPAAARRRFPVGPRRPDLPEWRRMMGVATEAVPRLGRVGAAIVVRDFAPADAGQWDAFVGRCPEATFFHRIGWRDDPGGRLPSSNALSAGRARRRDRRCPSARGGEEPPLRSRARVAAVLRLRWTGRERRRGRAGARRRRGRARAHAWRRAPRAPQSRGEMSRMAAPGSVRDIPPAACSPTRRPTCRPCRASSAR